VRHHQETLEVQTRGRGTMDLTLAGAQVVTRSGVRQGLCHAFLQHTSASLILCENADPDVRRDLEAFFARLIPDGDPLFWHRAEGPDDMAAHLRSVVTHNALTLPVREGALALGTWQGLYLWEHRTHPHRRRVLWTVQGV
jgi:secondary thiamine-phosphate synthase enzyme